MNSGILGKLTTYDSRVRDYEPKDGQYPLLIQDNVLITQSFLLTSASFAFYLRQAADTFQSIRCHSRSMSLHYVIGALELSEV